MLVGYNPHKKEFRNIRIDEAYNSHKIEHKKIEVINSYISNNTRITIEVLRIIDARKKVEVINLCIKNELS